MTVEDWTAVDLDHHAGADDDVNRIDGRGAQRQQDTGPLPALRVGGQRHTHRRQQQGEHLQAGELTLEKDHRKDGDKSRVQVEQ